MVVPSPVAQSPSACPRSGPVTGIQHRQHKRTRHALSLNMRGGGDDELRALIEKTKSDAAQNVPFSEEEIDRAERSLKLLLADNSEAETAIDWAAYRKLLSTSAHLSHKDWTRTASAAEELAGIVKGPSDKVFRVLFERVLVDGNWETAAAAAAARSENSKPWAVLVTGVNGIRKSSSVYQTWFKQALRAALGAQFAGDAAELPDGADPPPPRTKWTRRVPHPVLIGHAASLSQKRFRQLLPPA